MNEDREEDEPVYDLLLDQRLFFTLTEFDLLTGSHGCG